MSKTLPKIALLFAGGATIQIEGKNLISVTKESDTNPWLSEVPELSLIADIEPIFIFPDGKNIEPKDWYSLAQSISKNYKNYDGFVVLHAIDSVLYTSAALSFFLTNLTKPIVFTGSPLSPVIQSEKALAGFIEDYRTLGIRANLINAVQVATMNVPEVSLLFGNQLLRANRSRKSFTPTFNVFEADDFDVLGSVDFGIKLKQEEKKRKKGSVKLERFEDIFLSVIRVHPGFRQEDFSNVLKEKPDAILLHSYLQHGIKNDLEAYVRVAFQQETPVILFNPFMQQTENRKGVIAISGLTYEALYAKLYWVLSQAKTVKGTEKLLLEDRAMEFGKEGRAE